jgi:hypothetical protein
MRGENVCDQGTERLRARSDDPDLLAADAGVDGNRLAVGNEQQRCRLPESALESLGVHRSAEIMQKRAAGQRPERSSDDAGLEPADRAFVDGERQQQHRERDEQQA